jgi:SAM-dependent methyltransferase
MNHSSLDLNELGYTFQPEQRIWTRVTPAAFNYSDGDGAENTLYRIIHEASDVSIFSKELRSACTDWPTQYHLSSSRGNLLRPLSRRLKGSVLEIGAGCGAITRFLGENGGQIIAIEGSSRRAAIAAERTRDLANVTVINDHFDRFNTDFRFDVITLIGVLEYSGVFGSGTDPVQSMLESARRLLKPDGVLVVAIENQLGLKYFAGAPEDHLSVSMLGIQGLYRRPGVETFGRAELSRRFLQAGFQRIELALPFPDYKLPTSVILPSASAKDSLFDGSVLAAQTASRDAQTSSDHLTFSLECAWTEIGKNRLLPDLANSFLFAVSPGENSEEPIFDNSILAVHYSSERQAGFCKLAEFKQGAEGVTVSHNPLCPDAVPVISDNRYKHVLPSEAFSTGQVMSAEFIRIVQTPGWTAKQIAQFFSAYLKIVQASANVEPIPQDPDLTRKISGHLLDMVPQNIILLETGHAVIDQEWSVSNDISLGYLIFRSLTTLVRMVSSFAVPADMRVLNQGQLFCVVFAHLGVDFTESLFEEYSRQESEFMTFVSGEKCSSVQYVDWSAHQLPTFLDRSRSLTRPLVDFVEQLQNLSDTYLAQIKWLEGQNDSRREQLENIKHTHQEQLSGLNQIHQEQLLELDKRQQEQIEQKNAVLQELSEEMAAIKNSGSWRFAQYVKSLFRPFSKG